MSDKKVKHFYEIKPTVENYWRAIILFGRNSATYKFALAKALHEFKGSKELVKMEDLAPVFSKHIIEHLKHSDRQATNKNSTFLDALRSYSRGEMNETQMLDQTLKKGFVNVIDAFHNVHGEELSNRFYIDERKESGGIRLTDQFYSLTESPQFIEINLETESRWRLVETAWNLRIPNRVLSIDYDETNEELFALDKSLDRVSVTGARTALNGYQKGVCFYCFRDLTINSKGGSNNQEFEDVDVDHFFPHKLKYCADGKAIDGVANLVLACKECNRGTSGKFDRLPKIDFLERLHQRNEYLISSHHPLRENLVLQTGLTTQKRINTLQDVYNCSSMTLGYNKWEPPVCGEAVF